jgi:hypothetical protein
MSSFLQDFDLREAGPPLVPSANYHPHREENPPLHFDDLEDSRQFYILPQVHHSPTVRLGGGNTILMTSGRLSIQDSKRPSTKNLLNGTSSR